MGFIYRVLTIVALIVLLWLLLVPRGAHAEGRNNDWDHMGTTFAIQTISYGVIHSLLEAKHNKGDNRVTAMILSGALTFVATYAYSLNKIQPGVPMPMREVGMNAIGQAAAIGSILVFHF